MSKMDSREKNHLVLASGLMSEPENLNFKEVEKPYKVSRCVEASENAAHRD